MNPVVGDNGHGGHIYSLQRSTQTSAWQKLTPKKKPERKASKEAAAQAQAAAAGSHAGSDAGNPGTRAEMRKNSGRETATYESIRSRKKEPGVSRRNALFVAAGTD